MDEWQISNDTRGWIMCLVSGIACVAGASIICVDVLVRQIPGKGDFRIQDSGVFLACSLSLSFGVMLFSALVGMLPSSKDYLIKGGLSASGAEWTRLGCFVAGFVGIQVISRFLHRFIPSHVVDCDHTHDESLVKGQNHSHTQSHADHDLAHNRPCKVKQQAGQKHSIHEETPLLNGENEQSGLRFQPRSLRRISGSGDLPLSPRRHSSSLGRRPSMTEVQSRVLSFVKDTKNNCDEGGPCYGYSDPCAQECFKRLNFAAPVGSRRPTLFRSTTINPAMKYLQVPEIPEELSSESPVSSTATAMPYHDTRDPERGIDDETCQSDEEDLEEQHHHHVPTNAFMNIGVQTAIAIAVHKLPEGFINFATNHANPSLGFTVFVALLCHNVTEGFAISLPLFLALGSRWQAMLWSSLLGGVSQPIGAGIAAIWFKLARNTDHTPGFAVYGCMFAVTAGIMASVALALFVESLSVNHNTQLCIGSGLLGMAILGVSTALTA